MVSSHAGGKMSTAQRHAKIKLREVNRHLVCRLCRGYYVDATTIAECLHSFCRSCIIKYLEKNSFCPICEVQIHKTKPYLNLRLDKALQDVVYKVVPGLYHDEMKRRREFYSKRQEQIPFATPEQCGLEERIIFSPEDSISLSLEYLESDDYDSETVSSRSSDSGDNPDGLTFPQQLGLIKLKNGEGKSSRRDSQDIQDASPFPKRYLQCPAVVNIGHLKKFIKMKHNLTDKTQVNVVHKRVPLPDHYTLMDVAYIYTWKRSAPLRFFYQIFRTRRHKVRMPGFAEGKESKMETVAEEVKETKEGKSRAEEKDAKSEVTKSTEEGEKGGKKDNAEKGEVPPEEMTPPVYGNGPKVAEPEPDTGGAKSAEAVTSEPNSGGGDGDGSVVAVEAKEKCGTDAGTGKSEKHQEKGTKVEIEKRKVSKVEKNDSAGEVTKERENSKGRLLLNPISGQLESVPSNETTKPGVNGETIEETGEEVTKEGSECFKREIAGKGQKRGEWQNAKDLKKSNVSLLKNFRKEKASTGKEDKLEIKSSRGSSLTITPVNRSERPLEKKAAKFTVEIKAENRESEYDFDGSSPPGKIVPLQEFSKHSRYMADHRDKWLSKESRNSNWMSLQDFRAKMLKENNSNEAEKKQNKRKIVPSLYKINSEKNKPSIKKTPNGKLPNDRWKSAKVPRTVINIQTETEDKKAEIKLEVIRDKEESPPRLVRMESKDGREENAKDSAERRENGEAKGEEKRQVEESGGQRTISVIKEPIKSGNREGPEGGEGGKGSPRRSEGRKSDSVGAIDLSKSETSPRGEGAGEGCDEGVRKTALAKNDEKMMEALIAAAQKQSLEPLLKIPQYSQMGKNSLSQRSPSPGKNISPGEISQALQFLEDLRADAKVLEAKNQLNPSSVLEQFAQKSGNFQPYQELYQQKIDLIRRLKRHQQIVPSESDTPQRKLLKLSPTSDSKKKLSPNGEAKARASPSDEAAQYKSSIDKTLSQIQLMELHTRLLAAQNYKNLPALLQYYNRASGFCPGPTSPNKSSGQQKAKPSSHSPNSSKSPQGLPSPSGNATPGSDSPFFNPQNYLINAGLNSEMTYHQMFQSYLSQQEQMNQAKHSQAGKKPAKFGEAPAKALQDKYYVPQVQGGKKQEGSNGVAPAQKT